MKKSNVWFFCCLNFFLHVQLHIPEADAQGELMIISKSVTGEVQASGILLTTLLCYTHKTCCKMYVGRNSSLGFLILVIKSNKELQSSAFC